jgi:nitrate reductase NapE component
MIGSTDPQQTKTKHTTQKTKMIGNTDPPQTKTKHTTQKTKMISNTVLIILVFCVLCFAFLCGDPCCLSF